MSKLNKLLARCKCGVFLNINEHRDYYETAEQKLDEAYAYECPPEIDEAVRKIMIKTDTPIGSYEVWHYDLEKCLTECLKCLEL